MALKKILLILFGFNSLFGQINEFNEPWKDTSKAIIIDLYAGNNIDWTALKSSSQLTAIIHKASQGLKADSKYGERRRLALKNGYKWGSYHLGTNADPILQADYYLDIVGDNPNELLALDLESDDSSQHMNIRNALIFIHRIHEKVGRYPVVYCNRNMLKLLEADLENKETWSRCGLWYARFRKDIPDFSSNIWSSYSIWQFSSEINCKKTGECLHNVPGTLFDMDVNIYNGTKTELLDRWPLN